MNYEQLKNSVKKHCNLYYDLSSPEISDSEFDKLYEQLEQVEAAQAWRAPDSPTLLVGGKAGKIKHPYKLYSLDKVYEEKDLNPRFKVKTPKLDGTSLTLIYLRGELHLALTRGNGEYGDNVVALAQHIANVPTRIVSSAEQVVIVGECVTDLEVTNHRNYTSGALSLKSESEFKERGILFIAHDYLGVEYDYLMRMKLAHNMGFNTVLDKIAEKFLTDGVVYRLDSYAESQKLGYTSKHPKFAMALKVRGENTATTTLQGVEWAIGRTGTVNPTGIIDPVILDDATITRVTLHNIEIIESHNLGLGDTITIERAGGVIPKFINVVQHSKHNIKIHKDHAEKAVAQELTRLGPKLMVKDTHNANSDKSIEHFVKIMGIKGLGPASVKKLKLNHISDIYKVEDWDVLGANGTKVKEEVRRSTYQPYETVLAALGIKGVGKTASKKIVAVLPSFSVLRDISRVEIKSIGPATQDSVISWLDKNEEWVYSLPLLLEQDVSVTEIIGTKKVCITGKLDMTRNQLAEHLTKLEYQVTTTVTSDCYALINGGDSSSSKYKTAVKRNIRIVDYWDNKKNVLSGDF